MQEGLVHDADYGAITYVKPRGTVQFIAGMVDAFPTRQVPSYLLIGIQENTVVHNYMGMVAKNKGKTLIVPIPNDQVQPTTYDIGAFPRAYDEMTMLWRPDWSKHIAELTTGERYNVYGMDLFLQDIQIVPTAIEGQCYCRLLFSKFKVLKHGE